MASGQMTYEVELRVQVKGPEGSQAGATRALEQALRSARTYLGKTGLKVRVPRVEAVRVLKAAKLKGPACCASFTRQVWDGDSARTIGEAQVDVTRQVLGLSLDAVRRLTDCSYEADHLVGGTPEGDAHDGPFEVSVVDAVMEFFGVEDLAEVTQAMLQAARKRAGLEAVR